MHQLVIETETHRLSFACSSLAALDGVALMFEVAGPKERTALAAGCLEMRDCMILARGKCYRPARRYQSTTSCLASDGAGLLAVAVAPGFMPVYSPAALGLELQRFSAPVPWEGLERLAAELSAAGHIRHAAGFGCAAAQLTITQEQLDQAVADLIRFRYVNFR